MTGDLRYSVGIDLGTTNSAMACADLASEDGAIEVVEIPQLVNPADISARSLLPSFLYVAGEFDFPADSLRLPWPDDDAGRWVVGELARKRGSENPSRLVASAKSWLSYAGASRTSPILPWGAPEEVPKLSPVAASARYLQHLRQAWDARFAAGQPALALDRQDVLLTVPASFDEEARELTLRAAAEAGLSRVTLLEEPQAACYAWIDSAGERWRRTLRVGDLLLVCDIGGGTTDFSLIAVGERDGDLTLERVAIGDHILLGGDNMDLALARVVQQRLEGEGHRVDTWQLQTLWHQSRVAKETLFAHPDQDAHPVTILGKGTRLIGAHHPRRASSRRPEHGARRRVLPDCRRRRDAGAAPARGSPGAGTSLRRGSCRDAPAGAISLAAGGRQSRHRRPFAAGRAGSCVPRICSSTAA